MTREETVEIIKTMYAAYPMAGKGQMSAITDTVNVWAAIFVDSPAELVAAALKSYIVADVKGFPPSPGQIMNKIRQIVEPEQMTEIEAWALVNKAVSNSGYIERAKEEWEKLPEIVRAIVSPEQLREWAMQDSRDFQTVVASNFMRSFKAKQAARREYSLLPADVKNTIEHYRTQMLLKGDKKDANAESI